MLHFDRMKLQNFGPYKGEQVIDFTDRSGVTIFWGNNGRGKTTLLNAFRYALFGIIERRNGELKHLSEMENQEAAKEGHHGYGVVLVMTNDGDHYELTRQFKPRAGIVNPSGDEDYERETFLSKNGSILSHEQGQHELNMIMPEQVSRFFLFDAELLQEYEELVEDNNAEGDQIKKAIEKILGMPVLQNGVGDIRDSLNMYERDQTRAARADHNTQKYSDELERLNTIIDQHQAVIDDKEDQMTELNQQKAFLEAQMKETVLLRRWLEEKKIAEKDLKDATEELTSVNADIRTALSSAWKGMLLTTIRDVRENLEKEQKSLEDKKQKRQVANQFIDAMRRAVAERECPVCGQSISSDVIQHLQEQIDESSSDYKGLSETERDRLDELNDALKDAKSLALNVTDQRQEVKILEERKAKLEVKVADCQNRIDELQEDIKRHGAQDDEGAVLGLSRKYNMVDADIRDVRDAIRAEKQEMEEDSNKKQSIMKTIEKSSGGADLNRAKENYRLCYGLYQVFSESMDLYRDRLKKNVERDASDLFVRLTGDPDYVALRINDNYGLQIINSNGDVVPGRSSGYEHLVALSLIGALHKNAPLRGPIIIDSPFGRLDPTNKANIVRALPTMAEQSMLLAYNGEIDLQVARKELGSHLVNEFNLERVTSLHTEIKVR